MNVEIEKKYRLTFEQRAGLEERLRQAGAHLQSEEFEENTLYAGNNLDTDTCVLRLRRINDGGGKAVFTYKESLSAASGIKHQREDETTVGDADALALILDALGYQPALVYEKRRQTWHLNNTEVLLDELPFGFFMEIEADEKSISEAESWLALSDIEAESSTYPELTKVFGVKNKDGVIEARFK